MAITLRFIFISEADKPAVTLKVPEDMLFQEAFVLAAKRQGKDAGILTATYPGGAPLAGGGRGGGPEETANNHGIDPHNVGGARRGYCWGLRLKRRASSCPPPGPR